MHSLREMLAIRGITVSEFSRLTGIPQPTMHRIVNNRENLMGISAARFIRIAHALGRSAEELYFGDDSYDESKELIDRVFATTSAAGRQAMTANAIGVQQAFPAQDGIIPSLMHDEIIALKPVYPYLVRFP